MTWAGSRTTFRGILGPLAGTAAVSDHLPQFASPVTRIVPDVATCANYKLYRELTAMTDLKQFADRGNPLTIDGRWRQAATLGWGA